MLQGDIRRDFTEPYYFLDVDLDTADMARVLREVETSGLASLQSEGVPADARYAQHSVDVRYLGQEYFLTVPLDSADEPLEADFLERLGERFAHAYDARYGHSTLGAPIEIVTLRTRVVGALSGAQTFTIPAAESEDFAHEIRKVVFGGEELDTIVTERDALRAGHTLLSPAIIIEPTATTVVPPGFSVLVEEHGALLITNLEIEKES